MSLKSQNSSEHYQVRKAILDDLDTLVEFEVLKAVEQDKLALDRETVHSAISKFINPQLESHQIARGFIIVATTDEGEVVGALWTNNMVDAREGGIVFYV